MARDESDREDLLREAVALTRRAEFGFGTQSDPVFIGFKRDGGLSVYLGADPVYQFNSAGQLRRAYRNGLLYRTQGHTLARLKRDRSAGDQVVLERCDLESSELETFLAEMTDQLRDLQQQLSAGSFSSMESVPADADLVPEFLSAFETIFAADPPLAPAIPGKR